MYEIWLPLVVPGLGPGADPSSSGHSRLPRSSTAAISDPTRAAIQAVVHVDVKDVLAQPRPGDATAGKSVGFFLGDAAVYGPVDTILRLSARLARSSDVPTQTSQLTGLIHGFSPARLP